MHKKLVLYFGLFVAVACLLFLSFHRSPQDNSQSLAQVIPQAHKNDTKISGIVVPHHDLVKEQRAELFKTIGDKIEAPKTVILISPNHYESGRNNIQTTEQTWQLTNSTIEPNKDLIKAIVDQKTATLEPSSFTEEHGIKLVLADISRTFPKSNIVPIIFKIKTPIDQITALEKQLQQNCDNCLVVASVDFSHYQPAILGELHDTVTERAMDNLDTDSLLSRAEVDSPPALTLLTLWAKDHKTEKFVLHDHTNSGILTGNSDSETTTHFFGWYESGDKTVAKKSVTFTIGGDMMFGRMIAHTFLADGLWKAMDQLGDRTFWGTDAGIVNLEGPVSKTPVPDNIRTDNLTFNFPPQAIEVLEYLHVNAASQANNHSANAGAAGLAATRELLTDAAIQPFGGPGDDGIDKIATFKGEGLTLHIIGVHTLATQPDLAPLIKKIKQDSNARVIVFPHWGAEYQPKHGDSQEVLAHAWIDAGADAIIGAHPHVIQDTEEYKGRPIFYSMGNLLFDQTFSPETQQGLIISGEFTEDGLRVFALPVQSNNLKPAFARGETKKNILTKLYEPLKSAAQEAKGGTVLFFPK
jgi:AmmeMemoRadiSam system protein B